jgi:hypothetical protein
LERRDLLLLRTGRGETVELSCERLYMRFVDAEAHGTTEKLFEWLARELRSARTVTLKHTEWLAHEDLSCNVERILSRVTERGGQVVRPKPEPADTTKPG